MAFVNHTPFPALAFAGVDQRGHSFHVVALRQTYTWNETGKLVFADEQEPLCEADAYFGDKPEGSVRQESDLCPYKPRCDVIVNASAYAPAGKPRRRFAVRLEVREPGTPAPLPRMPQGLNQFMAASPGEMAAYQVALERAMHTELPGVALIDKTLAVTGPRSLVRRPFLLRLPAALVKLGTLGLVRLPTWKLTAPGPVQVVPVRLEHAFGGECCIDADSPAAHRVPKRFRLAPEHDAPRRDAAGVPVAYDDFEANPSGRGFARGWHLSATDTRRLPAPQIAYPAHPFTLRDFLKACTGKLDAQAPLVAGLGVRPKGYPERARLVGTVDAHFIQSQAALPPDFDFGVWNAAWPDQQADALRGDEAITLTNLCAPDTPAAGLNAQGNHVLRLVLPGHLPFVLVRFENGSIGELAARLDTVLVDPERHRVSCVWRATVATQPAVRVLEARMLTRADVDALVRPPSPTREQKAAHG